MPAQVMMDHAVAGRVVGVQLVPAFFTIHDSFAKLQLD